MSTSPLPLLSPPNQSPTSDAESVLSHTLKRMNIDLEDSESYDSNSEEFDASGYSKISEEFCTGMQIKWVAGSVWDTYAYQQHESGHGLD